jgi:hypothetical protein
MSNEELRMKGIQIETQALSGVAGVEILNGMKTLI